MSDRTTLVIVKKCAERAVAQNLAKLERMGLSTDIASTVRVTSVGALERFIAELESAMRNPREPPRDGPS